MSPFCSMADENFKGVTEDILNSALDGVLVVGGIVAVIVVIVVLYRGRMRDREDEPDEDQDH